MTGINAHQTAEKLVDWNTAKLPAVKDWLKKATGLLTGRELYTPHPAGTPENAYVSMPPPPRGETRQQAAERFINNTVNGSNARTGPDRGTKPTAASRDVDVLALARELRKGTIERVLGMSDVELGL